MLFSFLLGSLLVIGNALVFNPFCCRIVLVSEISVAGVCTVFAHCTEHEIYEDLYLKRRPICASFRTQPHDTEPLSPGPAVCSRYTTRVIPRY